MIKGSDMSRSKEGCLPLTLSFLNFPTTESSQGGLDARRDLQGFSIFTSEKALPQTLAAPHRGAVTRQALLLEHPGQDKSNFTAKPTQVRKAAARKREEEDSNPDDGTPGPACLP